MQLADQTIRARVVGQNDMFGLMDTSAERGAGGHVSNEVLPDWSRRVRLDGERDTLGLYLTGHPFEEFEHEVRPIISGRIADITGDRPAAEQRRLPAFQGKPATVAGMVFDLGKRGSRVIFTLDDRSGRLEASMFEDVWQQYRTLIAKSAILVVEGSLRFDEYIEGWRLTAKRVFDIDQAREQHARRLVLRWPENAERHFHQGARADAQAVPRRPLRSRGALPEFCSASRAGAVRGMVGASRRASSPSASRSCAATMAALIYAPSSVASSGYEKHDRVSRISAVAMPAQPSASSSSPATSSSPPAS